MSFNPSLFETYEGGERDRVFAMTDITLRDLFAMAAIHAMLEMAPALVEANPGLDSVGATAQGAYMLADAMLVERDRLVQRERKG